VRIRKARIEGFGKISRADYEFSDGLNCISGPNESGKTTLMTFLLSMLYGQAKTGLKSRHLEDEHDRYDPWLGHAYAGGLTVAFSDGREIVITRDFSGSADKVEITHGVSAVSLLGKYGRDRTREPTFLRDETGIDKAAYTSVFVLRHGSLASLSTDERNVLADRLTALADTGDEESSSDRALEILGGCIAQIGSERAPTKPYALTRQALEEQRMRLEEARAVRDEYAEALLKRRELSEQCARLEAGLESRRRIVAHSITAALAGVDEEIRKLSETLEGEPAAEAPPSLLELSAEKIRSVETKLCEFVRVRAEHKKTEDEIGEISARLEPMKSEYEAAIGTLRAVADEARGFLRNAADRKSDMLEQAAARRERLDEARSLRGRAVALKVLLAAAVIAMIAPFLLAAAGIGAPPWMRPFPMALLGAAAAALSIWGIVATKRRLAGFQGDAEEFERLQERLEEHDNRLQAICEAFGAQNREEAMEALAELDRRQREISEAEKRLSDLRSDFERLGSELQNAAAAAFDAAAPLGLGPCRSLSEAAAALVEKGEKTTPLEEPRLRSTYADVSTPADVSKAFEPLYAKVAELTESARRTSQARSNLSQLERRRDSLLAGGAREEIEALAKEPLPEGAELLESDAIPAERENMEALEERLGKIRIELAGVAARIEEGLKGCPDLAEIEETIVRLEERGALQDLHRGALDDAIRVINEAAETFHSKVFPRIESALQGLLSRVTLGAHDEVNLWTDESGGAPGLRISVKDAARQAPVGPAQLSQGALEQVYLCARLALADALSREEAMPVMLDDPFINYDPARLEAAVKVLAKVSRRRQVLLFTCQQDVCDLAAAAGAKVTCL